jgi:hypothetical protein
MKGRVVTGFCSNPGKLIDVIRCGKHFHSGLLSASGSSGPMTDNPHLKISHPFPITLAQEAAMEWR